MHPVGFYCSAVPDSLTCLLQSLFSEGVLKDAPARDASIVLVTKNQAVPVLHPSQILLFESSAGLPGGVDGFLLPEGLPVAFFRNALQQALRLLQGREQQEQLRIRLLNQEQQFERLMDIGMALSSERDHGALLARILTEARQFASCDAASVFLIEEDGRGDRQLVFKLTQNDSVDTDFAEQTFALDKSSLAGFAALEGEVLNFADVYQLPVSAPYRFNPALDIRTGYRTRSMLVIPMRTHDGRVTGVIQFLNRKRNAARKLLTAWDYAQETLPFDEPLISLLQALASQAAVAIENNQLLERIQQLFEGFVNASVHAIEQRDPATSGHSFRVADLTVALAEAVNISRLPALSAVNFTSLQLRELRYAALLHDFGKVGVREHVLVKARKLSPEAWVRFQYRLDVQHERVRNQFLQRRLTLLRSGQLCSSAEETLALEEEQALQRLAQMREAVTVANEPSILEEDTLLQLNTLRHELYTERDGQQVTLLTDSDFLALAVRRGSLTPDERLEIERHVLHTIRFLETIPWTPELSAIPHIAGAHHEKPDGSGYPCGLCGDDIPLGARVMAVSDIFDALTAADRPYKRALCREQALDILFAEARCGKADATLVQLFSELPLEDILPSLNAR